MTTLLLIYPAIAMMFSKATTTMTMMYLVVDAPVAPLRPVGRSSFGPGRAERFLDLVDDMILSDDDYDVDAPLAPLVGRSFGLGRADRFLALVDEMCGTQSIGGDGLKPSVVDDDNTSCLLGVGLVAALVLFGVFVVLANLNANNFDSVVTLVDDHNSFFAEEHDIEEEVQEVVKVDEDDHAGDMLVWGEVDWVVPTADNFHLEVLEDAVDNVPAAVAVEEEDIPAPVEEEEVPVPVAADVAVEEEEIPTPINTLGEVFVVQTKLGPREAKYREVPNPRPGNAIKADAHFLDGSCNGYVQMVTKNGDISIVKKKNLLPSSNVRTKGVRFAEHSTMRHMPSQDVENPWKWAHLPQLWHDAAVNSQLEKQEDRRELHAQREWRIKTYRCVCRMFPVHPMYRHAQAAAVAATLEQVEEVPVQAPGDVAVEQVEEVPEPVPMVGDEQELGPDPLEDEEMPMVFDEAEEEEIPVPLPAPVVVPVVPLRRSARIAAQKNKNNKADMKGLLMVSVGGVQVRRSARNLKKTQNP